MPTESLSNAHRVIETIAEREGIDATELPPLNDAIDPDALEALFSETSEGRPRGDGYVTFSYCDHVVTVRSDGRVTLDESDRTHLVE